MKKFFQISFLVSFLLLGSFFVVKPVFAQYFCETNGWAWSDLSTWIAFSCENYPPKPSVCLGDDLNDPPDFCCSEEESDPWEAYGVKISNPEEIGGKKLGKLEDYAWNDNVGWIDFGPTDNPPLASDPYPATLDFDTNVDGNPPYEINGWARIDAFSGDPDTGWISMSCKTDPTIDQDLCDDPEWQGYQVYYQNCQFYGWAWSNNVGWISFNCDTDGSVNCNETWTNPNPPPQDIRKGDIYKVACGAKPPDFPLVSAKYDDDRPCSAIKLEWEKRGGNITSYDIIRYDSLHPSGEVVGNLDPLSCTGETTPIICTFYDTSGLAAKTSYSYIIRAYNGFCGYTDSNTRSAYTTICAPTIEYLNDFRLSTITSEQIEACCAAGNIKLQWRFSIGATGYSVYQAMGGLDEVYQKAVTSTEPEATSCALDLDPEDGICDKFYYEWSKAPIDSSINTWISPTHYDYEIDGTNEEDPFVFKPNIHYYFFVRALDDPLSSNPQDVDSERVEICCQQ